MSTIQVALHSSPLPALEARMLMQYVTQLSRTGLISHAYDELTVTQLAQLTTLTQRRLAGEPMAYIIGSREFYGREFIVTPDVLIPRPDTETLIDTLLDLYDGQNWHVLDLGTGSGAIAITLALECPNWQVCAADISTAALTVAQRNATQLAATVQFEASDWLSAFTGQKFDLIVSNPPYIDVNDDHLNQGDLRFEPRIALTDQQNGLTNYIHLIDTVPDYLNNTGQLWFEHGYDQAEPISSLMRQKGYHNVRTVIDLGGNPRVTGGHL
ncbi:MAG: peptide chain release factor N(5)-glutamine methyltransferase [Formosimonas sp.]